MPQFSYKARRRSGEIVQGVLDVADRPAALAQIERLGLFPVAVDAPKGSGGAERSGKRGASTDFLPPGVRAWLNRPRKPKLQELATFTQQLANLIKAGMPLTMALNSMANIGTKGIPTDVSKQLKQDVMEGKSLSDAMAKQPIIFSDLYVNMVRAGEQSGSLVDVLRRMGDHFERFAEVQSKFKSALIYPAFVACVGVAIVIFFMTVMLPSFLKIFEGFKAPLPMSTQILIGASNSFQKYWWLIALVVVTVGVVFNRYKSTESGKDNIDRFKLNAPIFGKVMRLNLFGQFARTLGTLLQNGVPVLTALEITEQVLPNRIVKAALKKTREEVTDGKTIAQPLGKSKLFPQMMVDLIKIGEETGDVATALNNLAESYETELNIALRVMTNLIEPVMIVCMAVGVGFLLLSVLSAMFSMVSSISVR